MCTLYVLKMTQPFYGGPSFRTMKKSSVQPLPSSNGVGGYSGCNRGKAEKDCIETSALLLCCFTFLKAFVTK